VALRLDDPAAMDTAERLLSGRVIACAVGEEAFSVRLRNSQAVITDPAQPGCIDIALTPTVILTLIDGELTPAQAVTRRQVWLRGAPMDLAVFSKAVRVLAHGAMRSRNAERVLARYRRDVQNERLTM